jgi:hypothetical protein
VSVFELILHIHAFSHVKYTSLESGWLYKGSVVIEDSSGFSEGGIGPQMGQLELHALGRAPTLEAAKKRKV